MNQTEKPKSNYRQLQAMAKKLGLPGNLKHHLLEALIDARQKGDENIVARIIKENKEVRELKRKERAEAKLSKQNALNIYQRQNANSHPGEIMENRMVPVKRPQGRPRKNRSIDEQQPPQQSYKGENQIQPNQMKPRPFVPQYTQPMVAPNNNDRMNVGSMPHSFQVNYGGKKLYFNKVLAAQYHETPTTFKAEARSFVNPFREPPQQHSYNMNLNNSHYHLQNEYKSKYPHSSDRTMKIPVSSSARFDHSAGYPNYPARAQSCFPTYNANSFPSTSALQYRSEYPQTPKAVRYDNYNTVPNQDNLNESNHYLAMPYVDENHQVVSTTPGSDSTVSANETVEEHFMNADNSTYLVNQSSAQNYTLPHKTSSMTTTVSESAIASNEIKSIFEPSCSNQPYYVPSSYQFEPIAHTSTTEQDFNTYIPENVNLSFKGERSTVSAPPVQLSMDTQNNNDYYPSMVESIVDVSTTNNNNTSEVLPDLQELITTPEFLRSLRNMSLSKDRANEVQPLNRSDVVSKVVDRTIEEVKSKTKEVDISYEELTNIVGPYSPRNLLSSAPSSAPSPGITTLDANSNMSMVSNVGRSTTSTTMATVDANSNMSMVSNVGRSTTPTTMAELIQQEEDEIRATLYSLDPTFFEETRRLRTNPVRKTRPNEYQQLLFRQRTSLPRNCKKNY